MCDQFLTITNNCNYRRKNVLKILCSADVHKYDNQYITAVITNFKYNFRIFRCL
jgi:hypothetical protein